jgi:peptidoglycan hydrolase CwlO-like protein
LQKSKHDFITDKKAMTEKEFLMQVWRPYDRITTADGVPGKVLGVSFSTKSVRAFISGAPEWVSCTLIDTHTTGKGGDGDDIAIIEELRAKIEKQADEITRLQSDKKLLQEKISKNYLADILKAVNMMKQGLQEKKHKMEQIESGLGQLQATLEKIDEKE